MKAILGKKIGMTQIFSEEGLLVAVTAIHAEPNLVVGVKTKEKDGYDAVLVGYGDIREKLVSKPVQGQFKKANLELKRYLKEIRNLTGYAVGDVLKLSDQFKAGDLVDVQGTTRGHGFTGAIKLWNFSTGPRSHGAGWPHRYQGSLETGRGGAAAQRVWKGKKMSGRYGNETVSVINLEVIQVLDEQNLLLVKGAIPGRKDSLVRVRTTNRAKKQLAKPFNVFVRQKPSEEPQPSVSEADKESNA